MKLYLIAVLLSVVPMVAFGQEELYQAYDYICRAGYWRQTTSVTTYNFALCRLCAAWGDEYTSDGGTGEIETCYATCDDGTRAYWPNTCTPDVCAVGAYMTDDGCTKCPQNNYCPGDNTILSCQTTVRPEDPTPTMVYTLLSGFSFDSRAARGPKDCYCKWKLECTDGSCKTYESVQPCYIGPGNDVRLTPDKCSDGYYATGYSSGAAQYSKCIPCTILPENATFTGYGTPDANHENGDNCPWACNSGLGRTAADTCAPLCTAGITKLNVGHSAVPDIVIPLFENANTVPALHIKNNLGTCHADLTPGTKSGTINIMYNGTPYHTTKNP